MKINWKKFEVFMEFLIFGILIGVVEDVIAVGIVTDEPITWKIIGIVVVIAIPFAFLGEVLVDRVDFIEIFGRWSNKRRKKN